MLQNWESTVGFDLFTSTADHLGVQSSKALWIALIGDTLLHAASDLPSQWRRFQEDDIPSYAKWICEVLDAWNKGVEAHAQLRAGYVYFRSILSATYGRALFVTERGEYGLSDPNVHSGDEVWVLHGGRTPFVLRPRSSGEFDESATGFIFVNECYLGGVMDGEALNLTDYQSTEVVHW